MTATPDDGDVIRPAQPRDAKAFAAIYNHYILETVITFEEEAIAAKDMRARMKEVRAAGLPWIALEERGRVLGYAYAGRWRTRSAYRYSVESAIYLDKDARGRGLGTKLYRALFAILRKKGIHAVIGGITLPNRASVRLHEKFGFKKAAHFKEVGFKFGKWLDVGYWQRFLR